MKKNRHTLHRLFALSICTALLSCNSWAATQSNNAKPNPLKNVYFGEQHVHA